MIELMPRLSRDLWSAPEVATELNRAIGAVAAGISSGSAAPALRAALAKAGSVIAKAHREGGRPGHDDDAFRPLGRGGAPPDRRSALTGSPASTSGSTLSLTFAGPGRCAPKTTARSTALFDELQTSVGALEPADPDEVEALVEVVSRPASRARTAPSWLRSPTSSDYLDRIDELIADAETAYAAGEAFRADKLAARAYVENYSPVKDALSAADERAGQAVHESLTGPPPPDGGQGSPDGDLRGRLPRTLRSRIAAESHRRGPPDAVLVAFRQCARLVFDI